MILLIHPRWVEGESWGGYLLRLSEINGLDGVKSMSKGLNLSVNQLMMSSPHQLLPRLGIHHRAPASTIKWNRWTKLRSTGRSLYSRVCPMCLSQDQHPHIRSVWDLALNLVCEIHGQCLLDTCPSCSKPIDFLRRSIVGCTCGQDFRLIDMPVLPDHLQMVEQVFGVDQMRANASSTFAEKGKTERFGLLALRRLITLSNPDSCLIDHRRQGYTCYQVFRLHDLERVSKWFKDWPHGFVNGLRMARASYVSANRAFAPKIMLTVSAFPLIMNVLEIEANEAKRHSGEIVKSAGQITSNQVQPRDIVDIQTTCKMTGVAFYVVVEWIKRGFLGEVATSVRKTGRIRYEIDGQRARDVGLFFARTSTISKLAEVVGTESHALHRLAFAKVFPIYFVSNSIRLARVSPEQVFEIMKRLIGTASHNAAVPYPALSFSQAIRRLNRLTPQEIRKFMDDLGTEALPLKCREAHPIHLDDVLVSVNDLEKWRNLQSQRLKP